MRGYIRYGPIVILVIMLAACGPKLSRTEVIMTQQAAQIKACATLEALGTPYPCIQSTATLTPLPTPTMTPTPTPTPYSGWRMFTEDGAYIRNMPDGWDPDCSGVVGCPGKTYVQYKDGKPVDGSTRGTPGYWPYALVGVPVILFAVILLGFGIWQGTSGSREMAKAVRAMTNLQIQMSRQAQPALPQPAEQTVSTDEFGRWVMGFLQKYPNTKLRRYMYRYALTIVHQPLLPMSSAIETLKRFDAANQTQIVPQFITYLQELERSGS